MPSQVALELFSELSFLLILQFLNKILLLPSLIYNKINRVRIEIPQAGGSEREHGAAATKAHLTGETAVRIGKTANIALLWGRHELFLATERRGGCSTAVRGAYSS